MSNPKPVDVLAVKAGVIPVDEWRPEPSDNVVTYKDKTVIIPFDKLIHGVEIEDRNMFYVLFKDSYVKKFELITHYINYFIKYYDDGELILNYLACKCFIDNNKFVPNRETMIDFIYKHFVTPTMYAKIVHFVEDNYRIDLSQNKDPDKNYSESLEFTNEHAKILILISTFIKFLIPLVMHYISTAKGKGEVKKLDLYFRPLFVVTEVAENVCLYAKMYNSISTKVKYNEMKNRVIWDKYEANSVDAEAYTEELLNKNLIVDNIFKYNFSQNIISFNSVILKTQLTYRCVKNFGITLQEINEDKDSDGLSYLDKLEMNTTKIDESLIILSEINAKHTIKTLKRKLHIKIPKDEVEYYIKHHRVERINRKLVFNWYAKYFGGFTDLSNSAGLTRYIKLMIMMKKKLRMLGFKWLPIIISSNVEGYLTNRTVQNGKFVEDIEHSDIYKNLKKEKYPALDDMGRSDLLSEPIADIANTQFAIVDYELPDLFGEILDIDYTELKQEMLMLENQI